MIKQLSSLKARDASSQQSLERVWIAAGAAFGLLAVLAGAAGVHTLRNVLDTDALRIFETAMRFQMFHALALLAIGALSSRWTSGLVNAAGWLFIAGVLIFSGSLYILAITDIGVFGAVAPIGGLRLMLGWAMLIIGAMRKRLGEV